jgi:hypothetical protein
MARAVGNAVERATASRSQFGLLARNYLLALGFRARLGIEGSQSVRVELGFSDGRSIGVAELEPGMDVLDAVRRLIADVATVASRESIPADTLAPTLIVAALPNVRTAFYELLENIATRLNLNVNVFPAAALGLAATLGGASVSTGLLSDGFHVSRSSPGLDEALARLLNVDAVTAFGLMPSK